MDYLIYQRLEGTIPNQASQLVGDMDVFQDLVSLSRKVFGLKPTLVKIGYGILPGFQIDMEQY